MFKVVIIFCLIVSSESCNINYIDTYSLDNKNNITIDKDLVRQIDSVYNSITNLRLKKIISTNYINDSIRKIKILNNFSTYDLFYFNSSNRFIKVVHELENVY